MKMQCCRTGKCIRGVKTPCFKEKETTEEVSGTVVLSPVQSLNRQVLLRISRLTAVDTNQKKTRLQKSILKIGFLTLGAMTGKGRELADMMERRKFDILCVQETRWKRNKARDIGGGYKLSVSGANEWGRNGVGIELSTHHKENIIKVTRKNDRVIAIKFVIGEMIFNIVSIYAAQSWMRRRRKG